MKELYLKALQSYIEMLNIHIQTKTTDIVFHEATADFYEKLFEITHGIGEKHVDLGGDVLEEKDLMNLKIKANTIINDLLKEVEKTHGHKELTLGTEDMLGTIANDLENIEGTSRGFIGDNK